MFFSNLQFLKVERNDISLFVEKNHYSGSINGVISDYCFCVKSSGEIIGACIYGRMAMAGQWKRFGENENEVIELRRLCCIDDTPKNLESWFIAKTIKWLLKNTKHKIIVSYADAEHGHTGTIYKASNFKYVGFKSGGKVIEYNGKNYHDKTIRTKYKNKLKPFAQEVKTAILEGRARYKKTKGKHCYVYALKRSTKMRGEKCTQK